MKVLKDYYEKCKNEWFERSIVIWAFLTLFFIFLNEWLSTSIIVLVADPTVLWITKNVFVLLLGCVAPTAITITLYFSILDYINREQWKKKFPQYDVSGEWDDTTIYTESIGSQSMDRVTPNKSVSSPVHITQTCKTIKIDPSIGDDFEWHSITADWDDHGALNILYKVEYKGALRAIGYPANRFGYESMHIDKKGLDKKQKPHTMSGKFWHCLADDGKPMYMGDVTYKRK